MNKADDKRVRKTKKVLREGLAHLMMEKDLRSITVRELVDSVDIHRGTFYAHYKDIYDLYEQMEDMVIGELAAIMGNLSLSDEAFFETLISYIYDNAKICRMFLDKNGSRSFIDRVSDLLEKQYIEWMREIDTNQVPDEWAFFACYHIRGCLAIISQWAEQDFSCPKDKIVRIILSVDKGFDKLLAQ